MQNQHDPYRRAHRPTPPDSATLTRQVAFLAAQTSEVSKDTRLQVVTKSLAEVALDHR
jgi:hypothetical protein